MPKNKNNIAKAKNEIIDKIENILAFTLSKLRKFTSPQRRPIKKKFKGGIHASTAYSPYPLFFARHVNDIESST